MTTRIIMLILLMQAGCTQTRYLDKVRIDTIRVASPVIEKTLHAKEISDTVIIANEIIKKDTLTTIRYYPVEKKFYIKAKPDTVTMFRTDTLTQTVIKESSNYTYVFVLGVVGTITFVLLLYFFQKGIRG